MTVTYSKHHELCQLSRGLLSEYHEPYNLTALFSDACHQQRRSTIKRSRSWSHLNSSQCNPARLTQSEYHSLYHLSIFSTLKCHQLYREQLYRVYYTNSIYISINLIDAISTYWVHWLHLSWGNAYSVNWSPTIDEATCIRQSSTHFKSHELYHWNITNSVI